MMRRFTTRHFPEFGWKVLDDGEPIGDRYGPWWPTRRHALTVARQMEQAALTGGSGGGSDEPTDW